MSNGQPAADPRVIVALDFPAAEPALALVARLTPAECKLKVGKELFVRAGPALLEKLAAAGFQVFLDLKFHDIPNTVAQACAAAADLGVWMVNVHASGGLKMMQAAREAVARAAQPPKLIAVTVLTSMAAEDLRQIGLDVEPAVQVERLARLTRQAGLDGVVCSAQEAGLLRGAIGPDFLLVTPGIRPAGSATGDQSRILTPAKAIAAGADYLVVGRPITQAADPLAALHSINDEIISHKGIQA
ncbi:orotidine-5'-phosphate decarboxylase [Parasulfuritortus cantonensis]|uniref:Orotidine 5'-phosphate decarboxylase n=1 Tax=Parasulfuritortus cantonensis TaxID=2528202 RepID=A0A4R1B7G6_9PROT|nr:orotidine-5'-phosphate decarboxylase [Parasulfuritortus cantonensis]TCJ11733.1 orotidine-5'-phosphate decarboxylase [Parasulfuritortus cantonensis]